ncbi:MAG: type 4a pilus biogenesis protein PilO [Syntrophobacteraceae bacterium]
MKKAFDQLQGKISELPVAQKMFLFLGTLVFLCAIFYFVQFRGQMDTVTSLDRQIVVQNNTLRNLKVAKLKIKTIEKEIAKSEEQFEAVLKLLPDKKEIPGLLDSISRLGADVGLENILFKPEPERRHEFYATIPVQLDLVGTFDDLGVFLDSVSKHDRILKVKTLKIVRKDKSQTSLLSVNCELVTYRFLKHPAVKKAGKKR